MHCEPVPVDGLKRTYDMLNRRYLSTRRVELTEIGDKWQLWMPEPPPEPLYMLHGYVRFYGFHDKDSAARIPPLNTVDPPREIQDWMDEEDDINECPECDSCVLPASGPASARSFNEDIGAWDTSGVKTMYGMFYGASSFNRDIGDWAVDSVTHMGMMFNGALSFNQDIGGWAVHSVRNMQHCLLYTSPSPRDRG